MIRTEALRVFVTVADFGNIRDAADRLGRTASAISMTLKQLEAQLGAPLFETDRKHTLTGLGRDVRKLADDLLREHDRTTERIAAIATGREGALRIAAVPSVAAQLLPPILTAMLADHPGIRIELFDTDSASVHMLVETGEAELGIGGKPALRTGLQFIPLFHDPFRFVCRKDHPLARMTTPLTRADMRGHRMICNKSTAGFGALEDDMSDATSTLSARNVISLLALVQAGAGATLLPALATLSISDDLCALPLDAPTALRQVGFILHQGRSPSPICAAFQSRLLTLIRKDLASQGAQTTLPLVLAPGFRAGGVA